MENQGAKPDRPRREPRLGQKPPQQKAEALRGILSKELQRLRKMPPRSPRESPAYAALLPQADEIRALLADGWTANAIATEIASQHDGLFSIETIRNAIKRIESARPVSPARGVRAESSAAPRTGASTTTHAGFAEDPR